MPSLVSDSLIKERFALHTRQNCQWRDCLRTSPQIWKEVEKINHARIEGLKILQNKISRFVKRPKSRWKWVVLEGALGVCCKFSSRLRDSDHLRSMDSLENKALFDIKGKIAVVTGGGTGIGLMIARYAQISLFQEIQASFPLSYHLTPLKTQYLWFTILNDLTKSQNMQWLGEKRCESVPSFAKGIYVLRGGCTA